MPGGNLNSNGKRAVSVDRNANVHSSGNPAGMSGNNRDAALRAMGMNQNLMSPSGGPEE